MSIEENLNCQNAIKTPKRENHCTVIVLRNNYFVTIFNL